MTLSSSIALFFSMVILAMIPGPGVLIVTARSSVGGIYHGLSTTAGIVTGDYVFITLALAGLATLSGLLGELFIVIKYIGAVYLIWLGLSLIFSKSKTQAGKSSTALNHVASYSTGLVTTLSNPKAILFYLSFFPTFLDLANIEFLSAATIYLIATVAIGSVMIFYAFLATKAVSIYNDSIKHKALKNAAGVTLIGSGIYVAARG